MKNTSQSQNRLKWQITKYDSLKFSLKVRVKNSMFLNLVAKANVPQDPEIPLFSRSACSIHHAFLCTVIYTIPQEQELLFHLQDSLTCELNVQILRE